MSNDLDTASLNGEKVLMRILYHNFNHCLIPHHIEFLSELESLKASLEESMAQRNAQSKQLRTEQNSIRQKLEGNSQDWS